MCVRAQTKAPPSVLIIIQSRNMQYSENQRLSPYSTLRMPDYPKPTAVELFAGCGFLRQSLVKGLKYTAKLGDSSAACSLLRHA
jgi:hypothetical protein